MSTTLQRIAFSSKLILAVNDMIDLGIDKQRVKMERHSITEVVPPAKTGKKAISI